MAKNWAKSFYKSRAWQGSRKAYIARRVLVDGGMCEHCRERLGYIVDHKVELTPVNIADIDIALNPRNYQYLCINCHNKKTFGKNDDENEYFFDENGQLHPPGVLK